MITVDIVWRMVLLAILAIAAAGFAWEITKVIYDARYIFTEKRRFPPKYLWWLVFGAAGGVVILNCGGRL